MPQIHIVQSLQLGNKLSLFVTLLSLQPSFQHIPLLGHVHLGVVPGIPLASPACHLSQAPGIIEHQSADTAGMQTTDSTVNTRWMSVVSHYMHTQAQVSILAICAFSRVRETLRGHEEFC